MTDELPTVFVLGATGPAGICLLRELAFRKYRAVIYARNPAKVPEDLTSNVRFTIAQGEMDDKDSMKQAMAGCSAVLSLLGPHMSQKNIGPSLYADYYKFSVFPAMRELSIRRIIAMGTISMSRPGDRWTVFQPMVRAFMRLFASKIWANMHHLVTAFETDGAGLDWTMFRIGSIPGESDEESWKSDRDSHGVYVGSVGERGWATSVPRAALAKWMVDNISSEEWNGKMPALSRLSE